MRTLRFFTLAWLGSIFTCHIFAASAPPKDNQAALDFYAQIMLESAYLPADLSASFISCALSKPHDSALSADYVDSEQANYAKPGWHKRVAANWQYFDSSAAQGRITLIDFVRKKSSLGYRYLANANTQHELYEPWSSSKIFAFTGAVAKARQYAVGANSQVGAYLISDLITSVHSYEPFGHADGDSNAIASYFVNVAGRDYLTSLFHRRWLNFTDEGIRFRGGYAQHVFDPKSQYWIDLHNGKQAPMLGFIRSELDPGYQPYRCPTCGLTGNKAMTTLAQAEWLKRLASHERDPATRQPGLQKEDIEILFYGTGHSDKKHKAGGMLQGISRILPHALANVIGQGNIGSPNQVLDLATQGQWRIWQKIGWGESETRGAGEVVVLAHICLPHYQGGREFTLAAQTSQVGKGEIQVNFAGLKMQQLLDTSLAKVLK
jgi:hypothetical protein